MNDRERLIELLKAKYDHYCDQCGVNKQTDYIENLAAYLIANGVTIQKHGRWMYGGRTPTGNTVLVCSECRHDRAQQFFKEFDHYCPNCGAKMEG